MLIRTRIIIESKLGAEMPKLMRRYLHTHPPDNRTLDCNSQSPSGNIKRDYKVFGA
jgi:hypothetical protein